MIAFLKLIRLPNLLIIALTQYLVRYCLLVEYFYDGSIYIKQQIPPTLGDIEFAFLVISTMLVAAGGYVINDYFDTRADRINKPEKMVVDKSISRQKAMMWHVVLSLLSIAIGIILAYRIGNIKLSSIHIFSAALLWFYSTNFKKTFLIGNLVVGVLTAMVPLTVALFEPQIYGQVSSTFGFVVAYSIFALVITLAREIIKDIEDVPGDLEMNCKTLPIVWGVPVSKTIVSIILALIMVLIAYVQKGQLQSGDLISFWYFCLAIQLPIFGVIVTTILAKEKAQYHRASRLTKIAMLGGVLSMLVFYYSL